MRKAGSRRFQRCSVLACCKESHVLLSSPGRWRIAGNGPFAEHGGEAGESNEPAGGGGWRRSVLHAGRCAPAGSGQLRANGCFARHADTHLADDLCDPAGSGVSTLVSDGLASTRSALTSLRSGSTSSSGSTTQPQTVHIVTSGDSRPASASGMGFNAASTLILLGVPATFAGTFAVLWARGFDLADMMYVTRKSFKHAIESVHSKIDGVKSEVDRVHECTSTVRRKLVEAMSYIHELSSRQAETSKHVGDLASSQKETFEQVSEVRSTTYACREDLNALKAQVSRLQEQVVEVDGKQAELRTSQSELGSKVDRVSNRQALVSRKQRKMSSSQDELFTKQEELGNKLDEANYGIRLLCQFVGYNFGCNRREEQPAAELETNTAQAPLPDARPPAQAMLTEKALHCSSMAERAAPTSTVLSFVNAL